MNMSDRRASVHNSAKPAPFQFLLRDTASSRITIHVCRDEDLGNTGHALPRSHPAATDPRASPSRIPSPTHPPRRRQRIEPHAATRPRMPPCKGESRQLPRHEGPVPGSQGAPLESQDLAPPVMLEIRTSCRGEGDDGAVENTPACGPLDRPSALCAVMPRPLFVAAPISSALRRTVPRPAPSHLFSYPSAPIRNPFLTQAAIGESPPIAILELSSP